MALLSMKNNRRKIAENLLARSDAKRLQVAGQSITGPDTIDAIGGKDSRSSLYKTNAEQRRLTAKMLSGKMKAK